ncbi:hypothetical protein ACQPXM_23590 [Kribbella sp. CA-253562]|uniref:hypothetical protein n=1 Tax=Kribbella sp. CA-253562 TaxID=3239942 RepID=UPI003D8B0B7E
MIRRILQVLVVALSLIAGLAVAPTPATAAEAGAARLSKTLYLASYPPDGSETTWSRNIDLAQGNYKWYSGVTDTETGLSKGSWWKHGGIDLAAGTYFWYCKLSNGIGSWYDDYRLRCTLNTAGNPQAVLLSGDFGVPSGTYEVYSGLELR